MSENKLPMPRLLLEDYMLFLRGLVILAWASFSLAVITQITIRASGTFAWPHTADFSLTFNAVLVEFALNTLALTALLFYPNWYERVPRESAQRVRWLLLAVGFWYSLHLFAAFHVTGGVNGPLLLLLPVLVLAVLTTLPGTMGWLGVAYLLLGHLVVVGLEELGLIAPHGTLAAHFRFADTPGYWGLAALVCVLVLTLVLAVALRRWMYPHEQSLNPVQRVDPDTGLFRRHFLNHRIGMELGRIQRQGGSAALLLIELQEPEQYRLMPDLAAALRRQIRLGSDTPAIYQPGVMAVLLPTTGRDDAGGVAGRIVKGVAGAVANAVALRSAVSIASPENIDAPALMISAQAALKAAEAGGEPVIVSD